MLIRWERQIYVQHPSNLVTINAVEAFPLDDFSPEVILSNHSCIFRTSWLTSSQFHIALLDQAVRSGLQEAQRVADGSGSDAEKGKSCLCPAKRDDDADKTEQPRLKSK